MGAHITTEQAREFYEPYRAAFECGAPIEEIVVASGRGRSAIYRAAETLGWDRSHLRGSRTITRATPPRQEALFATCKECQETKPTARFLIGGSVRSTCRKCVKARERRSKGIRTRAEIQASAKPKPPTGPTVPKLRRELRALLRRLLIARVEDTGEPYSTFNFRYRYQHDPAFRERQIARTWARKAVTGTLRTDGRSDRHIPNDGTLDAPTVRRRFAEANDCPYCDTPMHARDKSLDHVLPITRGGSHSITNVVVCCRRCNSRKHARTPEEMGWRNPLCRSDTGQAA